MSSSSSPEQSSPEQPRRHAGDPRSDAELLAAHLVGDPHAFSAIFWRYRNLLKATAVEILRDGYDADDAVQEAMIRAVRYLPTLREPGALPSWLKTLTVRAAVDALTRRRRRSQLGGDPVDPDRIATELHTPAADAYAMVDLALAIPRMLEHMDPAMVATFLLVVICDEAPTEVARQLGVPLGTVKSRVKRCREQIRQVLRESLSGSDGPLAAQPPRAGD